MDKECELTELETDMTSSLHTSIETGHYSPMKQIYKPQQRKLYHIISEKSLSIITHVMIMASFEIYFYFNYIILMERKLFLEKINSYFKKIDAYYEDQDSESDNKQKISEFIVYVLNHHNEVYNYFYDQYIESKDQQSKLLNELLHISLTMLSVIFIAFIIIFMNALRIHKHISWRHILMENFMMFLLLGIFEYLFFTYIILQYTPITDSELQYIIYNNMVNIVNGTYS